MSTAITAGTVVRDRRRNVLVQGSVVRYGVFTSSHRAVVLNVHPDEYVPESGCHYYVTICMVEEEHRIARVQKVSSQNLDLVKW